MRRSLIALALLGLTGCGASEPDSFMSPYVFFTDPQTGCDYVVYRGAYGGGITPRMDADGKQVCKEPTQ